MLYTRKITNLLLLLLLSAAAITGCMNEEPPYGRNGVDPEPPVEPVPDYKENVTIQFRLEVEVNAGVGSDDQLLNEMDGFTIFLFDGSGGYLRQEEVTREYLQSHNNTVTLDIDPGNYQMVCWGNSGEYSMIANLKPGVNIADAAIVHTATQGGKVVVVPDGDPLYFAPRSGTQENSPPSRGGVPVGRGGAFTRTAFTRSAAPGGSYAFTVPEQGTVYADIGFSQAHKKLKVYVKNFSGTDADGATDCPVVHVGAMVCGYNFLLQPVGGAQLAYSKRTTRQADTRSGTTMPMTGINTPLFTWDDRLTIDVLNPADRQVCLSLDLIDELKKQNINPEDDSIREIRIDIDFDSAFDAAVSITIPEWNEKPVMPELN